ncbi:MAG: hypothetical protein WCH60_20495 [Burkholderiales bacterium]
MNNRHKIVLAVLISASALLSAPARTQNIEVTVNTRFVEAMDFYQLGKWAKAYERLAALADNNHAGAARIALLMYRFSPSLYGVTSNASKEQAERWARIASQQWASQID